MLTKIKSELGHFGAQTKNFRILVLTNLVYAFVLPVIDIFVAAYIMRSSNDPTKVVIYQLTIYTGIPLTFLLNGWLLQHFSVRSLYSAGMLLSGVSMAIMMSLETLDLVGIGVAGLTMGLSFGFYWSNRDYLSLANTNDENRNYYYGLETFLYTVIAVIVPIGIGWFIENGADNAQRAYQLITGIVFIITIMASVVCFQGQFKNPEKQKFIYLKFDALWNKFLGLAALKGMVQGFLVTAPAMLVMQLLGKEGALGTAQSVGAIFSAVLMYLIGRYSAPSHRVRILGTGLVLFALAAFSNAILFNATGVVLFMLFLLLARPLMDLAYFPIQYKVINTLMAREKRGEYAYILNHETGLYVGRLFGASTFLVLAYMVSTEFALRYAILIVALVQLASIALARHILNRCDNDAYPAGVTA